LTQAIYQDDPDDLAKLETCCQKLGSSATELLRSNPKKYHLHVRRTIPEPTELSACFEQCMAMYAEVPDVKGRPLFTEAAKRQHPHVCHSIKMGWVSDPPGIAMYAMLGYDSDSALLIYKCMRGTSAIESFHSELSKGLATNNRSVEGIHAWSLQMASWHKNEVSSLSSLLFVVS
jgi:hypothetical protein